jgi:UDP-N-acetylmuramate dehydrogenase
MEIRRDQKLSEYTTIGIGGSVAVIYLPKTGEELSELLSTLSKENRPYRILGNGSNVLADDRGIREAVVCTRNMERIFQVQDELITVDAGYPVAQLAYQTASKGLSGLEFGVGIPGSIGGVVKMNAGAHQHTISEVVDSIRYVMPDGTMGTSSKEDLSFTYRFAKIPEDAIITTVNLRLNRGDSKAIHEKIRSFNDQRTSTQPLKEKSAGCIFKNPGVCSAGKLIEDAGLKGFQIGGAIVSQMHANFIVNRGQATFKDVLNLIQHVKRTVKEKLGQDLQEEVVVWRNE